MQGRYEAHEMKKVQKVITGVVIGGGIGLLVGWIGKCSSGMCPLTCNPIISAIIGALLGVLFTAGNSRPQ